MLKDTFVLIADDDFKLIRLTLKDNQRFRNKIVIIDYNGEHRQTLEEFKFSFTYRFNKKIDKDKIYKIFIKYAIKKYLKAIKSKPKVSKQSSTMLIDIVRKYVTIYSFTIKVIDKPFRKKNKKIKV